MLNREMETVMKKCIICFLLVMPTIFAGRMKKECPQNQLFDAAWRNDVKGMTYAIKRGARLDTCNGFGQTVLMVAAKYGGLEVVEELVTVYDANMNHTNSNGMSALTLSIANKDSRVFIFLLNKHTDPTHVTVNGYTLPSLISQFGPHTTRCAFEEWKKKNSKTTTAPKTQNRSSKDN